MLIDYSLIVLISAFFALSLLVVMDLKLTIAVAGVIGLLIFISQFYIKDRKRFWFAAFLLALPLAAPKILGSREAMLSVQRAFGVPTGAAPAARIFFTDIILFILVAIWLSRLLLGKEKAFIPKLAIYLVLFIFWAGLSIINTAVFSYSAYELLRLIKFLILYIFIANTIKSIKDVRILVTCLAIGVLLQGAICFIQYKFQISRSITGYNYLTELSEDIMHLGTVTYGQGDEKLRGSGTVGPHNIQAMYFELLLPMLFCLAVVSIKKLEGLLYALAFISGSMGLYLTYSRGGFVGTIVGLGVLLIIATKKKLIPKQVLAAAALLTLLFAFGFYGKISSFMNSRKGAIQNRFEQTKVGIEMVKVHPVLGFGLNASVMHLSKYDQKNATIGYPVHNHYLIIASEAGLIGLALLLLFYYKTFRTAVRVIRSENVYLCAVSIGMLSAYCGVAIHMGWDHFGDEVIQTLLFIFAATVIAMSRLIDEKEIVPAARTTEETAG